MEKPLLSASTRSPSPSSSVVHSTPKHPHPDLHVEIPVIHGVPSPEVVELPPDDQRAKKWLVWGVTGCVTFALFVEQLNYGLLVPIFPKLMRELGFTQTDIGILASCFGAGSLVGAPICGPLADKYKVKTMLFSLVLLCGSTVMFAFCSSFHMLIVARLLQGVCDAGIWISGLALISAVAPSNQMGLLMGIAMSGTSLGVMSGPPVGGVLFDWTDDQFPFFASAALAGVALVGSMLLVKEPPGSAAFPLHPEECTTLRQSPQGSREAGAVNTHGSHQYVAMVPYDSPVDVQASNIHDETECIEREEQLEASVNASWFTTMCKPLKDFDIAVVSGVVALANLLLAAIEPTLPAFLENDYGLSTSSVGGMFLFRTIAYAIFSPLAGKLSDKWNRDISIVIGLFLCAGSSVVLFILPRNIITVAVFLFCLGAGIAMAETPALAEQALLLEDRYPSMRGTGYGLVITFLSLSYLIGPLVSGFLSERIGLPMTLVCFGLALLTYVPLIIWRKWRLKKRQTQLQEAEALLLPAEKVASSPVADKSPYLSHVHHDVHYSYGFCGCPHQNTCANYTHFNYMKPRHISSPVLPDRTAQIHLPNSLPLAADLPPMPLTA
eukprot:GILJ01018766.1.p1 GENE.GILJ01018766.1~~GILJ01018766.1.p1  ORF type:complete len:609 (-),score=48.36 GILJ01018766.1:131-1957(-)